MTKPELLAKIIAHLQAELSMLTAAALATHAEATDEENKAEDKYDTRGLEASYLAHGQSKAAEEAALALAQFQTIVPRAFLPTEPISVGALITLQGPERNYYFIGPRAGGMEISHGEQPVLVITPQSPLGRHLMGRIQGETLAIDLGGKRRSVIIESVV
ncbi:MAG: transcription elongation factor GreAB [Opitutaceae bacterium]|nr:transcription elongation factor GreAB [Opitutaceae bacterium]NBR58363.1 transcription elongation factor GreAB [Opitutaceae bacterium]